MNIQTANTLPSPTLVSGKSAPAQDTGVALGASPEGAAIPFVDVLATLTASTEPLAEMQLGLAEDATTEDDACGEASVAGDPSQVAQAPSSVEAGVAPLPLSGAFVLSGMSGQESSSPAPLEGEAPLHVDSKEGAGAAARWEKLLTIQLRPNDASGSHETSAPSVATGGEQPAPEPSLQLNSVLASSLPEVSARLGSTGAAGTDLGGSKLADHKGTLAVGMPFGMPVSAGSPEAANPTLKLAGGQPDQWRQSLQEALGERIQISAGKQAEQAVIRLDPPMMGSIEVSVRHQAGSLQVQLSATHNDVLRQLQNISESLRQDLVQRQYSDVSVSVHTGSRERGGDQQSGHQEENAPGRALSEAEEGQPATGFAQAFANA